MISRRDLLALVLASLALRPAPAAAKDDHAGDDHGDDHGDGNQGADGATGATGANGTASAIIKHPGPTDLQGTARNAVSGGKAVSLREVLDTVDRNIGGEVVDVKLVNAQGVLRYDLKIVDRRGRLIEISVDAVTKDIRKIRGF